MSDPFWRYLFDSDWRQRRDIEDLRTQLDATEGANAATYAGGVSVGTLRSQVHELSATVMILVDLLAEAGALDREKLRARVEGVLENSREEPPPMPDPWTPAARAAQPAAPSGDPYRNTPAEEPEMVDCSTCGNRVPERLTVITATGVICDACAARRA